MKGWGSKQDELKVYYRNSPDESWILLQAFLNSIDNWTEVTIPLSIASSQFQLSFEGNAKFAFGVCLDDIEITGTSTNTLDVSPLAQNVSPIPGNVNYAVTSNSSWTAASNVSWCTVNAVGDGPGEIIATYAENVTTDSRTADIVITVDGLPSQTVTLTQRGRGVSVSEIAGKHIRVFPNPSTGTFRITSEVNTGQPLEISILDLTGSVVLASTVKGEKDNLFDLSSYPPGFYFVKVKSGDNTMVQRLVLTK